MSIALCSLFFHLLHAQSGSWTKHEATNCFAHNGGIPVDPEDPYVDELNVAQCERACEAQPGCVAITRETKVLGRCWLRSWISVNDCKQGTGNYDTFSLNNPPPHNVTWLQHSGLNCYDKHGGMPMENGDPYMSSMTVDECETVCAATTGCVAIAREDKDQGNCWLRSWFDISECEGSAGQYDTYTLQKTPYVNHFPEGDNAYNIKLPHKRHTGFIFQVADFGLAASSSSTGGCCQQDVANAMKQKRKELEAQGMKLLFVAAGGDNFYWTGLDNKTSTHGKDQWKRWLTVYDGLTDVPWLAVHGNHDLGDSDPYAICPKFHSRVQIEGQSYGGNQVDEVKGGFRIGGHTNNFHLPDFNYYYRLDDLNFEYFALDQNFVDYENMGGEPAGSAHSSAACGSRGSLRSQLQVIQESGQQLMRERAAQGASDPTKIRNVLVIQHYPDQCERLEEIFRDAAPTDETVDFRCVYGHTHDTECNKNGTDEGCLYSMIGGGGGCCSNDVVNGGAGYGVLSFLEEGGMNQDLFFTGNCNFDPASEHSNATALLPCPWTGENAKKCQSDRTFL